MNNDGNMLDFSNWWNVIIEVIEDEFYVGKRSCFVYSSDVGVEKALEDNEMIAALIKSNLGNIERSPEVVNSPRHRDTVFNNLLLMLYNKHPEENSFLDILADEVDTDGLMEPQHYNLNNFVVINSDNSIKQLDEELWKLMY